MVSCKGTDKDRNVCAKRSPWHRECSSPLWVQVLFFGSHPDLENDDCFTGIDFYTKEEAIAFFKVAENNKLCCTSVEYIEIDLDDVDLKAAGIERYKRNPYFKPSKEDYSEERREAAIQAGMAFGCQGYNDTMSY